MIKKELRREITLDQFHMFQQTPKILRDQRFQVPTRWDSCFKMEMNFLKIPNPITSSDMSKKRKPICLIKNLTFSYFYQTAALNLKNKANYSSVVFQTLMAINLPQHSIRSINWSYQYASLWEISTSLTTIHLTWIRKQESDKRSLSTHVPNFQISFIII